MENNQDKPTITSPSSSSSTNNEQDNNSLKEKKSKYKLPPTILALIAVSLTLNLLFILKGCLPCQTKDNNQSSQNLQNEETGHKTSKPIFTSTSKSTSKSTSTPTPTPKSTPSTHKNTNTNNNINIVVQKPVINKKDLEGIKTIGLPENVSISQFTYQTLFPYFKAPERQEVTFKNNLQGTIYNNLNVYSKEDATQALTISNQAPNIKELISHLNGKKIIFNKSKTVIVPPIQEPNGPLAGISLGGLGRLIVMGLFESKQGLLLKSDYCQQYLYLAPINRQNLRYLGIFADEGFDDKPYYAYYNALSEIKNLNAYNEFWKTLIRGYKKENFVKLSLNEQKMLHDTVGIFMAEEFRLKARNGEHKINQILPAGMIVCMFLTNGGEPLQGWRAATNKKVASQIPKSYKEFMTTWHYYDRGISSYLEKNHPDLCKRIKKDLDSPSSIKKPNEPERKLLQKLVDYVENPKDFNSTKEKTLEDTLKVIWEEAPNIKLEKFIPLPKEEKNLEEDKKIKKN